MKTYTFSVYVPVNRQRVVRRRWWNLWGRDEIVTDKQWEHRVLHRLDQQAADMLIEMSSSHYLSPSARLFIWALGGEVSHFQLEEIPSASPYIATRGHNASSN